MRILHRLNSVLQLKNDIFDLKTLYKICPWVSSETVLEHSVYLFHHGCIGQKYICSFTLIVFAR